MSNEMNNQSNSANRKEMLEVNKRQRSYYEVASGHSKSAHNGLVTNLWRTLRKRTMGVVTPATSREVFKIHKSWMGDLSGANVLELGCGNGSNLSAYMAKNSREYHAIDLSSNRVAMLEKKLQGHSNARFHVGDVLEYDFAGVKFDVIYAKAIIHHFRHIDVLFDHMDSLLTPQGQIITMDPVQSWLPARAVRSILSPFQTDADWEWPFTASTLKLIEHRYNVQHSRALYRRAKWAMVVGLVNQKWAKKTVIAFSRRTSTTCRATKTESRACK
jgi:2-polyprenyl-3-methyl-5-hydroxy-6-metoxy-1,4-benzoquinol methylase